MGISVGSKRTTTVPSPVRMGSEDKLTVTVQVDVLGSDLLHDREAAIKAAAASAKRLVRRQLAIVTVRS